MGPGFVFIIIVVGFLAFWFWLACIRDLMDRRDDEFPGKNDKVAWAIILVFTTLLGAVLYSCRKRVGKEAEDKAARLAAMLAMPADMPETVECPNCKRPILATAEKCMYCDWRYFKEES